MPARGGAHVDRKLDLPARRRGAFGDQLRLDPTRVAQRGGEQQGEQDQEAAEH